MTDVLYLHGFASGPGSTKARAFRERLDLLGRRIEIPALDGGDFARLTISGALARVDAAAEALGDGYAVVGSSFGGYLALLHAARAAGRPRGPAAVVAMAPAIDFPTSWPRWMSAGDLERWAATGWTGIDHHGTGRRERLSYDIVRDARAFAGIEPAPSCPVLVFHGLRDDVVPCGLSERFARGRSNVTLRLLDDDHSLLATLPVILDESVAFLRTIGGGDVRRG
ncbi:MAG: YqiA/YcfP family alpha/beta fold hydrolase [Myxococcota bacterium]|nr:YqiA/YcfP family alpha/beta fold hydrolase [Myxococcota bacterium]